MIDATPLLRGYARWRAGRLARQDPSAEQQRQLLRLVQAAAATRFGRDHRFDSIRSVEDFQAQVPLRRFEDIWTSYWQAEFPRLENCTWPGIIPFFALTSGTTSAASKQIPCSWEMNRTNEWAAIDILVHHVVNRPASRVAGGKTLMLGGSSDLTELAPGIRSGDLSGIVAAKVPWWARAWNFPPPEIALLPDWETKLDRIAHTCLSEDIRVISGTPSWMLVLFDRLFSLRPGERRLRRLFPKLELVVHGGVNFSPYRHQFEQLLADGQAELREVYPASEGFFAIADRAPGEALRMIVDNGLFFEFVPVDDLDSEYPRRDWIGNARSGIDYALVVSSCAGLWAYVVGDTIRLSDLHPPRLFVTGRLSYMLSAFGEHLSGEEIEAAISGAAGKIEAEITDFSVGPVYPNETNAYGRHLYIVEFARPPPGGFVDAFAQSFDARLRQGNDDYRAHRSAGVDPPAVLVVRPGAFAAWMKRRGRLGGQNKVPRVITNPKLFEDLRQFMAGFRA